MRYQSFEPGADSESFKKWQALKLTPALVRNKVVLDIGCNEGYFEHRLLEGGAKQILGIDVNPEWIRRAQDRLTHSAVEFRVWDWNKLSQLSESFNLILILSAFHYAASPEWFEVDGRHRLLEAIKTKLAPGGLLVWEGGLVDKDTSEWSRIDRGRDVVYHPTRRAWEELLRKTFAGFAYQGPSVQQKGDPVPRHVYHIYQA